MYYILSILLIVMGALLITAPQLWYELTESWKSQAPSEPSGWFLFSTRFGGAVSFLVGAAYLIVNLFF